MIRRWKAFLERRRVTNRMAGEAIYAQYMRAYGPPGWKPPEYY